MQKVERKKRERGRRKPLAWVLVCAVLLAGCVTAGILLRKSAEEEPEPVRRRISGAIVNREAAELESMTVTQRGKEPWTAVRDGEGGLRLQQEDETEPGAWTVSSGIAASLTDVAVNLTYEDVFTEDPAEWETEKAAFGLADPAVTAVFRYTDGQETTVHIGNSADPEGDALYYMSVDGDDRLFAVGAGTLEDLNTEKALLHPVTRLDIRGALLDRITVRNGDGTVRTEWALQGNVADRDAAENWLVTAPFVYPADYDTMQNLRDNAENLRLGVYIGDAEEGLLKECGLDKPTAILEMHMQAGSTGTVSDAGVYDVEDWEERLETLTVGGEKNAVVAYVRYGDEIYTLNHFSLETFTKTDPLSTAARYTVMTPLNSLESVLLERQGAETVSWKLIRTDSSSSAETDTEPETEERPAFRCMRNGEEVPADTFSAAWERLLTVTVSGRLPEGWQAKEPHTRYTFITVSGGKHTVELSDYDGIHDAVTLDGHTLFYLIKGGMTELP